MTTSLTTTRRAVLGAIAIAPALALPTAALATPETGPLQGFAEAWLQRFTEKGGIYHYDQYMGRFAAWIPEYHFSPGYERDKELLTQAALPQWQRDERMTWAGAFYDGKMRELYALAQAVPGGMDAIEAALIRNPALGVPTYPEAL